MEEDAIQQTRQEQATDNFEVKTLQAGELPYELYVKIFGYLSPLEIGRLLLVCKAWHDIAQDGALWARIYRSLWPGESAIEDWYGCWKIRLKRERSKERTLVAVDCGSSLTKMMFSGYSESEQALPYNRCFNDYSVMSSTSDHHGFWHPKSAGMLQYGRDALKNGMCRIVKDGNVANARCLAELVVRLVDNHKRDALQVPCILLCVPVTWSKEWEYLPPMVHLFKSPLICAEDASVLVLASYGLNTGIVVDVGHDVLSVSPVYEGKLLRSFVRYVKRQSSESVPLALQYSYIGINCIKCRLHLQDVQVESYCGRDNLDSSLGTCLCTACRAMLARRVGRAADDSSPEHEPPINRLALEEEQDLTHTYEWIEAPQDPKELKKAAKATKRAKEKRNDHKGGRRGKKATIKLEEEENEEEGVGNGDTRKSSAHVAAAVLVLVLETMEREKNSRELNRIEVKALRDSVVVTGGRTSTAGWDESFASQVSMSITIVSSAAKKRREKRQYDAVRGACAMAEARPKLPFDYIFPHSLFKTSEPLDPQPTPKFPTHQALSSNGGQ